MNALNLVTINTFSPYLVLCSRKDDQQAQRARLFLRWFNGSAQQQKYLIKSTDVKGEIVDGKRVIEYIAMIVPRSHPHLEEIVRLYDEEIQMFNESKP